MLPTIATGNVASSLGGGYEVANSCRFNGPDNSNLTQTSSGTPTNRRKCTLSFWIKHDCKSGNQCLIQGTDDSGANSYFQFELTDVGIDIQLRDGSGATYIRRGTKGKRIFRDPSAWYHFVVRFDSTEGSAGDRFRVYINGTQDPLGGSDDTGTVDSNYDFVLTKDSMPIAVGSNVAGGGDWSGYMAELVCIDGDSLAPTSFGEFDEDSPTIWKPIDVSGLTFGTNGFYCDFEDSGDLGDDESGNTNDFTENNLAAADQAVDTPTNNFATLNFLDRVETGTAFVLSEGNCKVVTAVDTNAVCQSSIAVSSGKWYAEFKVTTVGANLTGGRTSVGVGSRTNTQVDGNYYGNTASPVDSYGKVSWAASYFSNNGTAESYGSTFVDDDIIGVYLDLDNNKLYFSENGTLYSATGIDITAAASTFNGHYHIGVSDASGNDNTTCEANYGGCPAFAISSGNADDNGYGNFEYSPNITGDSVAKKFYALCTKNLAKYG